MKKITLILILLFGILLVSCDLFDNENENEDFCIEIDPDEAEIAVGEELLMTVEIEDVEDLFAMSAEIIFDAAVLELPAEPLIIGSNWGDDFISSCVVEMDRLNIAIGLTNNGNEELEGEFDLFQFKVVGKAAGETMVNIHNLNLYDEEGNTVEDFDEIEIKNAAVIVQ